MSPAAQWPGLNALQVLPLQTYSDGHDVGLDPPVGGYELPFGLALGDLLLARTPPQPQQLSPHHGLFLFCC